MLKRSIFFIATIMISGLCFTGCSDDDDDNYLGNWVDLGDFTGKTRSHAVTFTIGDNVYVGTGYDYDDDEKFNDFWKLTISGSSFTWTQIASLPGVERNRGVAFASDTKGYVGLGSDDNDDYLKDFFCYDPSTDTWTEIEDEFPDDGRIGAFAFYVDGKGYVGTGKEEDSGILNDCYSFDPSTETWAMIADLDHKRKGAMSFVLDGVAYVVGGVDNDDTLDDFYKYDSTNNEWVELNRISDYYDDESFDDDYDNDIERYEGVAFVSGGKVYLTTGIGNSALTWEWDSTTDRWEQKSAFEGSSRYGAIAFTIDDVGYVATGGNGSLSYDDISYFVPNEEQEDND